MNYEKMKGIKTDTKPKDFSKVIFIDVCYGLTFKLSHLDAPFTVLLWLQVHVQENYYRPKQDIRYCRYTFKYLDNFSIS